MYNSIEVTFREYMRRKISREFKNKNLIFSDFSTYFITVFILENIFFS